MTKVALLGIVGTPIRVKGLDKIGGSPVVDIFPWTPPMTEPRGEVVVQEQVYKLVY